MKTKSLFVLLIVALISVMTVAAQNAKPAPPPPPSQVDGKGRQDVDNTFKEHRGKKKHHHRGHGRRKVHRQEGNGAPPHQ